MWFLSNSIKLLHRDRCNILIYLVPDDTEYRRMQLSVSAKYIYHIPFPKKNVFKLY